MLRSVLVCVTALTACTLGASPLGDLPGDQDSSMTTAAQTTKSGPTTTTNPTEGDPGSTGPGMPGTTSTGSSSSSSSSGGDDTGEPTGSAWEQYCEYINTHGGECDPNVDMAPDLGYPGSGFIVHEWGTDTIVVGSNGHPQRGLHHEEEDLPAFVYDRVGAGQLEGSTAVIVKMETPVTYFYSDAPLGAKVSVGFPEGVFTQWYPAVSQFTPAITAPGAIAKHVVYDDPVLNPAFPFLGDECRTKYADITGGLLDWGTVEILGRGVDASVPDAPLADFTWSHARAVDANLLKISGVPGAAVPQHERFLFYRGLGNFPLPLTITASEGPALAVANNSATAVGRVFVVHVDSERGAFLEWKDGLKNGASLGTDAPSLAPAPPLDLYAAALAERVTDALDATGLYHDEAVAMVETWKRQWFSTPGLRVLYLVPQPWTEASIPLTVEPAPQSTTRVMMIRTEVITVEQELVDVDAAGELADLDDPAMVAAGKQHFLDLGRFAEPRLRRASALLGDPAYLVDFLAMILHADTRVAAGE